MPYAPVQSSMIDTLYVFSRGAFGFAFMVIGAGSLVEPGRKHASKALSALYLALGFVFLFSWFSEYWILPFILDNFLVIAAVFVISQGMFEISLYLFGDEKIRGLRSRVYKVGAVWSLLLWLLPFLDHIFRLPVLNTSVEDARPMAFFQTLCSSGVYIWPVAITIISMRAGKWRPSDIPNKPGATRALLIGITSLLPIFGLTAAGLFLSSQVLYRMGQMALQVLLLLWYFYTRACPDIFLKARQQIGQQHKQRQSLSPVEIALIADRLQRLVQTEQVYRDTSLSVQTLARKMRIPAYRLSAYFNSEIGMTFPAWLNATRIDYVCRLLENAPNLSILEVSMEAGYSSKAVFNHQFLKRTGLSPREYRVRATANSGIVSTNQDDIHKVSSYI